MMQSRKKILDELGKLWHLNGPKIPLARFILDAFQSGGLMGLYQIPDRSFIKGIKEYYKNHNQKGGDLQR